MKLTDTPRAGQYQVIYADPPWQFTARSPKGQGRHADRHYDVMTLEDIKSLPVADIAGPDCVLFLWAIDPMLPQALEVMAAWGFEFKTVGFYWTKRCKRDFSKPHIGTGYWTRANPEQCLLGTRGRPKRINAGVRKWVDHQVGEHSHKPPLVRARIERLMGDVPRLEMFSRQNAVGWDAWGNEVNTIPAYGET